MSLFVPPCLFPLPVCINICVLLFVWAASLMSVCFSGSLLSASIHCIHCNIFIAQKINFDWLIDWLWTGHLDDVFGAVASADRFDGGNVQSSEQLRTLVDPQLEPARHQHQHSPNRARQLYKNISICYFCFRWKTVSLVQASMQHLMHRVTVSLQQSKITLQNNCINRPIPR